MTVGILDKLKKSQSAFDENWIMDHKEFWKKKFRNLTTEGMENRLNEIESRPAFDSSKLLKRELLWGVWGAAGHISDREKESQRRALRELLGLQW